METKEKFDVRNQVNDDVVMVAAEAAGAEEARGKDREVNDTADVQADEATVTSVEQDGTAGIESVADMEVENDGAVEVAEPGGDGCGETSMAEPGGDGCGDSSVAELVERARQEGYESGYSRGYEEARVKSIDEWMQESIDDAGEVWDYGEESEVMILNNIRPSVWG